MTDSKIFEGQGSADKAIGQQKVQVWIIDPFVQRILLLKTTRLRGGFFQPVTGKVEVGESLLGAAIREGFEETGLKLSPVPLNLYFDFLGRQGVNCREYLYWSQANSNHKVQISSVEHDSFQWLSLSEAKKILESEGQKPIFLEVLNMIEVEIFQNNAN